MTSPSLHLLMALFSFLPFSYLSILLPFFPSLPLLPTSASPCGGLLKVSSSFFSLLIIFLVLFLVSSLLSSFTHEFLHLLVLSRRTRRRRVFYTRLQRASLMTKIFLVLVSYHTYGLCVVADQAWLLQGLWLSPWFDFSSLVESVITPIVSRR